MSNHPTTVAATRIDASLIALAHDCRADPSLQPRLETAAIERFTTLTHRQRCELAASLNAIAALLQNEIKYVPRIFDDHIKIRVASGTQARQLQEKLFSWGCGFHHGSYPLCQSVELGDSPPYSVHVSPTGAIGLNFDANWYPKSQDRELALADVLNASTPPRSRRDAGDATPTP